MSREILINVTPSETRVAMIDNGMLQELMIERSSKRAYTGNIYMGRVLRIMPGMQAAFVDIGLERSAFLHLSDIRRAAQSEEEAELSISDVLTPGQVLMLQVVKDPLGTKGARLTTHISLPSRYMVLTPGHPQIGVSLRIPEQGREQLRSLVEDACDDDRNNGFIVRTNAEDVDTFVLRADMAYLEKLWQLIEARRKTARPGDCVYEDLPLYTRVIRDSMTANIERVRLDSSAAFDKTLAFVRQFLPEWTDKIELYQEARPIFDLHGVEDEINRALERQVNLKSGGHLVIDQTEAMTTIDVNTGSFIGYRNHEDTIFKTNLEAAQAIARQLRLRNLGGIIIIDFIDMADQAHRDSVLETLSLALAADHAKTSISGLSELGLVEMTRKRTSESLEHVMCEPCLMCNGVGYVKTSETVAFEIFREIIRSVRQFNAERLMVMAAPQVVDRILDDDASIIAELEEALGKTIRFKPEDQYSQEQFDVVLL